MKYLFISLLLITCSFKCTALHFIAQRDYEHDNADINKMFLSDRLNNTLNKLDLIEVWIDETNQTYKIHSRKSDFKISGQIYALNGGTAGYRYYCYIGDSKQKITLATIRCAGADCTDHRVSFEIYGGDDFYVSFSINQFKQ